MPYNFPFKRIVVHGDSLAVGMDKNVSEYKGASIVRDAENGAGFFSKKKSLLPHNIGHLDLVVVSLGTNDAGYFSSKGNALENIKSFQDKLTERLEYILNQGATPIMLGTSSKGHEWDEFLNGCYPVAIMSVAESLGVEFLPTENMHLPRYDSLHYTNEGYRSLFVNTMNRVIAVELKPASSKVDLQAGSTVDSSSFPTSSPN